MKVEDSRRITGPHLLSQWPGAILDISGDEAALDRIVPFWRHSARKILDALGWASSQLKQRRFTGGASLLLTAPIDCLYVATEVNEWAWEAAVAGNDYSNETFQQAVNRLRGLIGEESNQAILTFRDAALEKDVAFLADDDAVSLGMGRGSRTWPVSQLPAPSDVDWQNLHDIPTAFITGTNGKTTTVRLLQAMVAAADLVSGVCSTDYLMVGDEIIDKGDYSGPGGARSVLRHPEVDVAILETARGGMLRRGLAMDRAHASLVTNIGEDHLGEYGIQTVAELAQAKMTVAKGLSANGHLVLNADDSLLRDLGSKSGRPIVWFSCQAKNPLLSRHLETGGNACFLEDDALILIWQGQRMAITTVDQVPIAFGGAAMHNVANALAAIGIAKCLGLEADAIRTGLQKFQPTPDDNPGRANFFEAGGVKIIVDFAHNPHGLLALTQMGRAMPAKRRLIVLGQAGDREDRAIRELGEIAALMEPDLVIVKELADDLRGREPGIVPALIEQGLREGGCSDQHIEMVDDEMTAIERALTWARAGDLLLLICHVDREAVLARLTQMQADGWQPEQ